MLLNHVIVGPHISMDSTVHINYWELFVTDNIPSTIQTLSIVNMVYIYQKLRQRNYDNHSIEFVKEIRDFQAFKSIPSCVGCWRVTKLFLLQILARTI